MKVITVPTRIKYNTQWSENDSLETNIVYEFVCVCVCVKSKKCVVYVYSES